MPQPELSDDQRKLIEQAFCGGQKPSQEVKKEAKEFLDIYDFEPSQEEASEGQQS